LTVSSNNGRAATRKAVRRVHSTVAAILARIGLRPGDRIAAGVSGGPDSVALLHALHRLRERVGFALLAVHFNHRSRGEESEREEAFVRQLCARLGVELHVGYGAHLAIGGGNWEERAREQRHLFFCEAAHRHNARFIALGHHADDQAETVLMRLLRGCGIAGLGAMAQIGARPFDGEHVIGTASVELIRPLLTLTRKELLAYLHEIGAEHIVDSSNLSCVPIRNRIRHELMPALERDYAPGISARLVRMAEEMRAADDLLTQLARTEVASRLSAQGATAEYADVPQYLVVEGFEGLHPALRPLVIREFLRMRTGTLRRLERIHLDAIVRLCIEGPPNGRLDLPSGWRVRREYGVLEAECNMRGDSRNQARFALMLPKQGELRIAQAGFRLASRVIEAELAWRPKNKFEAVCDADQIDDYLLVRCFEPGDRVRPLNMSGTRKIKDVFIDNKLPLRERRRWPIVVSGGQVLWIPGIARSGLAIVGSGTRSVLHLTATPLEQARNVSLPGI
jgi:tRNA(Ile)-lysidine synthase